MGSACILGARMMVEQNVTLLRAKATDMNVSQSAAPRPLIPAFRPLQDALAPLGEPLVRFATGLFLIPHGAQKLFGWFGGQGIDESGAFFITVYSMPGYLALIAGLIEFFAGLALALGFATRLAAALVAALMLMAVVTVRWGNGFFWTESGFEYPLLWGILALSFVFRGGGRYSLDHALGVEL
jgi:putative oxidoreductase